MGDQPRLLSLVCPPRINRAARVRALLAGERVEADSAEAVWGYRLRHHHVGTVCGVGGEEAGGGALVRLEQATREVAAQAGCEGRPLFVPRDECSAGAWLPPTPSPFQRCAPVLPETQRYPVRLGCAGALASPAFAAPTGRPWAPTRWGRAVGPSGPRLTSYTEVAPLALMSSSVELLWTWMQEILGQLADDDD